MEDVYARRVEKAIFNWYYGGENAAPEPIFNALHDGFQNEMQVLVPIETPEAMLQMMGDPTQVKVGDTFTNEEPIAIKFRHLVVNRTENTSFRYSHRMKKWKKAKVLLASISH